MISISLHAQQKKKSTSSKSNTKSTTTKTVSQPTAKPVQKQEIKTNENSSKTKSIKKSGFDKNKLELGGNIQGNFSSNAGAGNSTDLGITAFAGYKFTNNISAGVKIGKTFRTNISNFEFGLYGRYYYDKFFGGAGLNFSSNTVKLNTPIGTYKSSYTMTYISLEGGYRIPVSDKITMETSATINIPLSPTGADTWFGVKAGAVYNF